MNCAYTTCAFFNLIICFFWSLLYVHYFFDINFKQISTKSKVYEKNILHERALSFDSWEKFSESYESLIMASLQNLFEKMVKLR